MYLFCVGKVIMIQTNLQISINFACTPPTQISTDIYTRAQTHNHVLSHIAYPIARLHTHSCTHNLLTNTQYAYAQTHTNSILKHACIHTHTYTLPHPPTHAPAHRHTHTPTHIDTHTHTHTHT